MKITEIEAGKVYYYDRSWKLTNLGKQWIAEHPGD